MSHGNRVVDDIANVSYKYELGGPPTKQWHTKRHKGSCRGLEFSPNGNSLVSVGKDAVIKLADAETGKVIAKDTEAHTYSPTLPSLMPVNQLMP
jgi:WD40 repeat protein